MSESAFVFPSAHRADVVRLLGDITETQPDQWVGAGPIFVWLVDEENGLYLDWEPEDVEELTRAVGVRPAWGVQINYRQSRRVEMLSLARDLLRDGRGCRLPPLSVRTPGPLKRSTPTFVWQAVASATPRCANRRRLHAQAAPTDRAGARAIHGPVVRSARGRQGARTDTHHQGRDQHTEVRGDTPRDLPNWGWAARRQAVARPSEVVHRRPTVTNAHK